MVHMGEETKAPGSAIPFTMVWAIVANGVMAAIITITYVVSSEIPIPCEITQTTNATS